MSGTERRTTRQLFKEWRSGDAQAGQLMAQQVADWYYAIATSRLGERRGRKPCDAACAAFGQGVVDITESRKLVPWAHSLIVEQLKVAGNRASDGDEPSAYTGSAKPKGLLLAAREALPAEVALLEVVYGADADRTRIDEMAEPLGGNPLGILKARYAVKRWLRDQRTVPFEVAPTEPVLDRAPLPLYESDRMASSAEEAQFEQWMLTDLDLCKDIAEFAHFSIALRGGLPTAEELAARAPRPQALPDPEPPTDPGPLHPALDDDAAPAKGGGQIMTVVVVVLIVIVLLGFVAAAAAGFLFMM